MTVNPFGAPRQSNTSPKPAPTVVLTGKSGTAYTFRFYPLGQKFKPLAGVYALMKETAPKKMSVRYIGETHDFEARVGGGFINHHKWSRAVSSGVTHVAVHVVSDDKDGRKRCAIELDLIHHYSPSLNDQ